MTQPDFVCYDCDQPIPNGEKMWSVLLNQESFDQGSVTVHDSTYLHLCCERCAAERNLENFSIPRKDVDT